MVYITLVLQLAYIFELRCRVHSCREHALCLRTNACIHPTTDSSLRVFTNKLHCVTWPGVMWQRKRAIFSTSSSYSLPAFQRALYFRANKWWIPKRIFEILVKIINIVTCIFSFFFIKYFILFESNYLANFAFIDYRYILCLLTKTFLYVVHYKVTINKYFSFG